MFALVFDHPFAFALLAAPIALLLWARRARAEPEYSGTLELWREAKPPSAAVRARSTRSIPPSLALAALALALGVCALAAPRSDASASVRTTRVLLDDSPSMYLPWAPDGAPPPSNGANGANAPTRLERALSTARAWFDAHRERVGELEWTRWRDGAFESVRGAQPPSAWIAPNAARSSDEPPPFERVDREGWIWITDRAPSSPPKFAGLFASGGAAIPGAIAESGGELVIWNGSELSTRAREPRGIELSAEAPSAVVELAGLWAKTCSLEPGRGADVALAIRRVRGSALESRRRVGRDGWWIEGQPIPMELEAGERAWLADVDGRVWVAWRPGLVRCAWIEGSDPGGDPAAFAIDWSRLFDDARLAAPGVVSLAERGSAGAASIVEPKSAFVDDAPSAESPGFAASVLAALAVACALLAVALF